MDTAMISAFIEKAGVKPLDIAAYGHIPLSPEQLIAFSTMLVQECARVQSERSCQRHGYDKYEDSLALLEHFKLQDAQRQI